MNETNTTFFQIPPAVTRREGWSSVQFMNDTFSMYDIEFISAVYMEGTQLYRFDVKFTFNHKVTYSFQTKAAALKAQRELSRAFTRTGEFAYVEPEQDTDVGVRLES